MLKRLLITLIAISCVGCVSAPETKPLPNIWKDLKPTVYTRVNPIAVPDKPVAYVVVDKDGNRHSAFKPEDLRNLKLAFNSAQTNADLVRKLDVVNELIVIKLNLMEELRALEEYKSAKLENDLIRQDAKAERDLLSSKIEKVSWQIVGILALIVGL